MNKVRYLKSQITKDLKRKMVFIGGPRQVGGGVDLRYLRDRDGREVDFVVLKNNKPLFAVECKTSEYILSSHIRYFQERTQIPAFYQVHLVSKDIGAEKKGGRSLPFWKFCHIKNMP